MEVHPPSLKRKLVSTECSEISSTLKICTRRNCAERLVLHCNENWELIEYICLVGWIRV